MMHPHTYAQRVREQGFTLIETLVAISLLSIAIVAPMSLTSQALSAAYYARDQITAFNLAQEGLEAVRGIRDNQILEISKTASSNVDLFGPIPVDKDFTIDSRVDDAQTAMQLCSGTCPSLQTDGELYGYDPDTVTWTPTTFMRVMHARWVGSSHDEIRLEATVSWPTASGQVRTFTIYENLYRWVNDGSAATQ